MKEENKAPKKGANSIFRKKWFFPAVYLTIAAILLGVVIWYQNIDNHLPNAGDDQLGDNYTPHPHDENAVPVMDPQEIVKLPVGDQEKAEIVTKFWDYDASLEDQESALILHNNRYYQSTGVDIVYPHGEAFDVLAALSGTVMETKEDPLLGNVVILSHGNDITTYYASLGEVTVDVGDEVKQGDVLGTAGENVFGKNNGTHVHFEIRKADKVFNPEEFFNQPVSKLDATEAEDVSEEDTSSISSEEVDSGSVDGEDSEETGNDSVENDAEETGSESEANNADAEETGSVTTSDSEE